MRLKQVEVRNFRLLKKITVNIEHNTTNIVGKNNSGKTAFGSVFRLFLDDRPLSFEDISLRCHKRLIDLYKLYKKINSLNGERISDIIQRHFPSVSLRLTIEYTNQDNWSRLKPFITKLDNNNEIKILLEYTPDLSINFFSEMDISLSQIGTVDDGKIIEAVENLISRFILKVRPDTDEVTAEPLKKENVLNLIRCHFIDAQRAVDDSSASKATKLSKVFQKHYDLKNGEDKALTQDLNTAVEGANDSIDLKLKDFFKNFTDSFSIFGFPGLQKQNLELKSDLDVSGMLKTNVKLYYNHENKYLSEKYNGLGYSNLIYIISQILSYQILNDKEARDLTLIFIEEPEAHMHPQMQDVFVSQINKFLKDKQFNVQLIISTHSSHIISKSELSSIRYFTPQNGRTIIKDLLDFDKKFSASEALKFLKQYLTLGECDLFFADKAILFEGTVERLLLPIFIEKISASLGDNCLKKQYVASVEVGGAYMDNFKEFLKFLDIKTLLITDIDSVAETQSKGEKPKTVYTSCPAENKDKIFTSNATLKNWLPKKELVSELIKAEEKDILDGKIRVTYQRPVDAKGKKCGRSFEEAFIIENNEYIFVNKDALLSIANNISDLANATDVLAQSYEIQRYIDKNSKKTNFAFDLVMVGQDQWSTPTYIKDGLTWLAK
jgi:predicted ATP-dependent endonuclease of OLD family